MARYLCSFSHIASGFVNELSRRTHLYFSTHLVAEMNVSFLKSNVAIRYAVVEVQVFGGMEGLNIQPCD